METPLTKDEFVRLGMRIAYWIFQGHRDGQAAFNALHDIRPDVAEQIRGASNPINPFYHDDRVAAFWEFLFNYGNGSVNTESHS